MAAKPAARERLRDDLAEERVIVGGPGHENHEARYRRALLRLPRGSTVLDAGSGAGFGAAMLSAHGHHVIAADASLTALSATELSPSTHRVAGDVTRLPLRSSSVDGITCFEVIEHVPHPGLLVAELGRVLRPGGVLCLSTPHATMELLYENSNGRERWHHHISPLTPLQLRRLLLTAFSEVRLFGQTEDLGILHLVAQSADVLGLRLRLGPERQAAVRRLMGRLRGRWSSAGATVVSAGDEGARLTVPRDSERPARFSRLAYLSAAQTYVEAVR